jgi:hypothetical protein
MTRMILYVGLTQNWFYCTIGMIDSARKSQDDSRNIRIGGHKSHALGHGYRHPTTRLCGIQKQAKNALARIVGSMSYWLTLTAV